MATTLSNRVFSARARSAADALAERVSAVTDHEINEFETLLTVKVTRLAPDQPECVPAGQWESLTLSQQKAVAALAATDEASAVALANALAAANEASAQARALAQQARALEPEPESFKLARRARADLAAARRAMRNPVAIVVAVERPDGRKRAK